MIGIDLVSNTINILQIAEKDIVRYIPASELNEKRDEINALRVECGEMPLTEEKLPIVTEDEYHHIYGMHAIQKIKELCEAGKVPEKGVAYWY